MSTLKNYRKKLATFLGPYRQKVSCGGIMKKRGLSFIVVLFCSFLVSCNMDQKLDLPPEEKAPDVVAPLGGQIEMQENIMTISKDFLVKPLLMEANFISQMKPGLYVPSFTALESQVVYFHQKGEKIFLMKSVDGKLVTDEFPAQMILADFQILDKDTNESKDEKSGEQFKIDF